VKQIISLADWELQKISAMNEISEAINGISQESLEASIREITNAKKIAVYACGREGLTMKAFAMRLFHAGLNVNVVGEMTTPYIGTGDLLILTCGPGEVSTVKAIANQAKISGARILYFTAQPAISPAELADSKFFIPAQTMANDTESQNTLPMGSAFEISLFLVCDLLVNFIKFFRQENSAVLRARHTNME
jgi:6-phospho-3-hexuloisomerase